MITRFTCAIAIACVAAAGCKSSSDSAGGAGSAKAEDRCQAAITNAMNKSKEDIAKANPKMAALVPQLASAMVRHCGADQWSTEATKCLADASTADAIAKCQSMLSADQLKKLNDEMMTIVSGGLAPGSNAP